MRVCDDDAEADSCVYGSSSLTVSNAAPVISSFPAPAPVDEVSGGVSVQLLATATDVGTSDTLSYAYDCDDDGSVDVSNGGGSATCVYAESGTHQARVTVSDDDGASATATVPTTGTSTCVKGPSPAAGFSAQTQPSVAPRYASET